VGRETRAGQGREEKKGTQPSTTANRTEGEGSEVMGDTTTV